MSSEGALRKGPQRTLCESAEREILREIRYILCLHYEAVQYLNLQLQSAVQLGPKRVTVKAPEIIPKWGNTCTVNDKNL